MIKLTLKPSSKCCNIFNVCLTILWTLGVIGSKCFPVGKQSFRDYPFSTYAKFTQNISCTLIRRGGRGCGRNVSFSENFAYLLNGWPLSKVTRYSRYFFEWMNKCNSNIQLTIEVNPKCQPTLKFQSCISARSSLGFTSKFPQTFNKN